MAPGEPSKCAQVGPAWPVCGGGRCHGEPFAYHIVNRYFDQFIPRAIALADEARCNGSCMPYSYMTQSWIASLYLDCANAGMLSWPGNGGPVGRPTLHCPNVSHSAAPCSAHARPTPLATHCLLLTLTSRYGLLMCYGHPRLLRWPLSKQRFGVEISSSMPSHTMGSQLFDASLLSSLGYAKAIANDVGIPAPVSVRAYMYRFPQRLTMPRLPDLSLPCRGDCRSASVTFQGGRERHCLAAQARYCRLSFGAEPRRANRCASTCVWRDEPSGADVILTYETAYGTPSTVLSCPTASRWQLRGRETTQGPRLWSR